LNNLVYEARFNFDEEGLRVRTVDPANVALVMVHIPARCFEKYLIDSEMDSITLGLDVARIYDFCRSIKNGELVEMWTHENEFFLETREGLGHLRYAVSLIDPSAIRKEPKEPKLDLPVVAEFDMKEFKKFILAATKVSDDICFDSTGQEFKIYAESDTQRMSYVPDHIDGAELPDAKSRFSLEYLTEFVKVDSKVVKVHFGTNLPARFTFYLDSKPDDDLSAKIEYFLAPRIEAE